MEHECKEEELIIIDIYGDMVTSRCPVCGAESSALVCFVVPPYDGPMCNVFIEWTSDVPIALQIRNAKRLDPKLKKLSNHSLIAMAREKHRWKLGELSLPEGRELVKLGKDLQLMVVLEVIES